MADANFSTDCLHILSRSVAKRLCLVRYFTGQQCKYGHIAERATVNGFCLQCSREKGKANYWANRNKDLARQKAYREANRDKILAGRLEVKMRDREYAKRKAERERIEALRQAAIDAGERAYSPGLPCPNGHIAPRFIRDGKCIECNRISCTKRTKARAAAAGRQYRPIEQIMQEAAAKRAKAAQQKKEWLATSAWHIASQARARAKQNGAITYASPKPCPEGHIGHRYTSGGGCVACLAEFSTSDAKKRYDKKYYRKNVERIRLRTREYVARNHKRTLDRAREWARRNPEKRKAISANYSHRRRAWEGGGVSTLELFKWKRDQKKSCYWCGNNCRAKYHIDHYTPLSRGGRHEIDNLVIACPSCNHRKSAKDPYEFAAQVGRLF